MIFDIKENILSKKDEQKRCEEQKELLEAFHKTQEALNQARIDFNFVSAPELIDASVYEINSLQARYNYLLRRLREEKVVDSTRTLR